MRTTQPLLWNKWMRNGRNPARPPLRFTECKKLELKDRVTLSSRFESEQACNAQMMDMMSCFKTNDFDQSKCAQQINTFKKCYQTHLEKQAKLKKIQNSDVPVPGQNKLSTSQVNYLLKRYPQPR